MKKGEEKSFDVDFSSDSSMLGQTLGEDAGVIHFDVKVDTIKKKVLPELSDEWAHNNFGFENLADMRTQIAQSIKDQKEMNKQRRVENECLAAIASRVEGEMPTAMCELQEVNLLQSFYQQLSQNGYTFDQYLDTMKISSEQFKQDMKQQAEDTVRQDMALDAWARHNLSLIHIFCGGHASLQGSFERSPAPEIRALLFDHPVCDVRRQAPQSFHLGGHGERQEHPRGL